MKYLYVIGCTMLITACGKSLTYQEVESLKTKCERLGGSSEYKRYGMIPEGSVSDVDCKINGIVFRHGKY